jgi:hypothetical protein
VTNTVLATCRRCEAQAQLLIVADDVGDSPDSFTIIGICMAGCSKTYTHATADEMHAITGLPRSGWSETPPGLPREHERRKQPRTH